MRYGHDQGRALVKPDPVTRPLRVLSAAEQAKVAENRAAVHEHLPEMLPFIKKLHEAGLIDGWRSVVKVELFKEGKDHGNT
ncbi:MAG: hypothetical protein A2342_09495 [Gallionellales bacterium RIFOXYB12_FULL_54_9]|nr:MAG: hypothetical protein A2342_09495 [Gallionellales bacterium RIFOXYB12_FULL_54_9]